MINSRNLALLCAILVWPTVVQGGNRTLDTPTRFPMFLSGSTLVVNADFTGDETADVLNAAANGAVVVSPGRGDGSFGIATSSLADGDVRGIADFDEDGTPDLYVKKPGVAYAIRLGLGNGRFGMAVDSAGSTPDLLAAGDFNGDSSDDMAAFTAATGTLTLSPGNGTGGFLPGSSSSLPFSGPVRDIATGDFDGDGKLDLILTGDQRSVIAWNDGGTFSASQLTQMPGKAAAAGDVNGDGRTDAVVIHYTSIVFNGTTSVAFGSSARSMNIAQFPIEGSTVGDVTVAQMDGSGGAEIIVAMRDVTIHSYDGIAFRTPRSHAVSDTDLGAVTAADFDGDGKSDLIVSPRVSSSMMFLPGHGDGTVAADPAFPIRTLLPDGFKQALNATDLNGDGRPDLTLMQYDGVSLAVALGTESGFASPVLTPIPQAQTSWDAHRAGDLNADGRADVILTSVSQSAAAQFSTWLAQSNGTFVAGPFTTGAAASRAMLVADLTGDGRSDVVDSGGRLYIALGGGGFSAPIATGIAATSWMYTSDLNNDGKIDVTTWTPSEPGLASIRSYLNNGGGSFGPAVAAGPQVSFIDGIIDATGDGLADMISFSEIFRGMGDGTFAGRVFTIPQPDFVRATPWSADFDGDGTLDLAVSGAISYGGNGTFESATPTAVKGEIFSLADADGNGSPDLWLADAELGRIAVIRTRRRPTGTAAIAMSVSSGGQPTDRVVTVGGQFQPLDHYAVAQGSILVRVDSTNASLTLLNQSTNWTTHAAVPTGTPTISAIYSGDRYYASTNASTTRTVEKRAAHLYFPHLPNPEYGSPVILCASVWRPDPATMPPATGVLTYSKGTTTLGTSPASPSSPCEALSVTDPALFPIGTHTIDVDYPGDDGYLPDHFQQSFTVRKAYHDLSFSIPAGGVFEGQPASIAASFVGGTGMTGTITFTWNGTAYPVPVANGQAVLTAQLPWGNGQIQASYSGDSSFETSSAAAPLVVYRSGDVSSVPIVRATATPNGASYVVTIAFSQVKNAEYFLYHSINGAALTLFRNWLPTEAGYPTEPLPAGAVGVYAVVAHIPGGASSPISNRDLASGFTFADDPLLQGTTIIKGSHVAQLQTAINAVRIAAGLAWTTFAAPTGTISAAHLTSLRQSLTQARSALGLATPLTDPTITPGVTSIRAVHLQELREAVK